MTRMTGDNLSVQTKVPHGRGRRSARLRARRGSVGVYIASAIPIMIMMGSLSFDQAYIAARHQQLRLTTQAAALAAAGNLTEYYYSGSQTALNTAATNIAGLNMPSSTFGNVITAANITLGTYASGTFTSNSTTPTAVQVVGLMTTANSNPLTIPFGGMFGLGTVQMSSTAVATPSGSTGGGGGGGGAGGGNSGPMNVMLLNDLSESFTGTASPWGELSYMKTADNDIINCLSTNANSPSKAGLASFDGNATTKYNLTTMTTTTQSALETAVNGLEACQQAGTCSGSNAAAGFLAALNQFNTNGTSSGNNNIVIITDGVPGNNSSVTYGASNGMTAGPSALSSTNWMTSTGDHALVCSGTGTSACSDAQLATAATNMASYAKAQGVKVWVFYYTGDDGGTSASVLDTWASSYTYQGSTDYLYFAPGTSTGAIQGTVMASVCSSLGNKVVSVQ